MSQLEKEVEKELEKAIIALLSGTTIEEDEHELAQLRKLPVKEQLEVGLVLREAMRQEKDGLHNEHLAGVKSVAAAQRFLDTDWGSAL